MGYLSYLVRRDNRTVFELGKSMEVVIWDFKTGSYFNMEKEIKEIRDLLKEPYPSCYFDAETYRINDREVLKNLILTSFADYFLPLTSSKESELDESCSKIISFCDNQDVFMLSGSDDFLYDLKKIGYKVTGCYYNDYDYIAVLSNDRTGEIEEVNFSTVDYDTAMKNMPKRDLSFSHWKQTPFYKFPENEDGFVSTDIQKPHCDTAVWLLLESKHKILVTWKDDPKPGFYKIIPDHSSYWGDLKFTADVVNRTYPFAAKGMWRPLIYIESK